MFEQTKKTTEQIVARISEIGKDDWMGTQQSDLIDYLPYEFALKHLNEGVTKEQWDSQEKVPPLQAVFNYLEFAWGKANNQRGLSAGRSLDHMKAWLWLAGYEGLLLDHFSSYNAYGKKQLIIASIICGFDWESQDDGEWDGFSDIAAQIESAKRIADLYLAKST